MGEVGMYLLPPPPPFFSLSGYISERSNFLANFHCFRSLSGKTTGIPIHVFGTETHMTAIVGMALGCRPIPTQPPVAAHTANFLLNTSGGSSV